VDDEERWWVLYAGGDRDPGSYYLCDTEAESDGFVRLLGRVNPSLSEAPLSAMEAITYQSRDGLTIHGYLTLPNGKSREDGPFPVIVNPHGGPWFRDVWRYNPEVQFLASRGFAVFQMNFRGSTGYGKKFWTSSFKQWGLAMQDDVSDGVKWLVDQGIADPKRVGIYGGSYGGYCTLAGVTFSPELYACAADYVGVSNLFTFLNSIPPYWEPYREMMYEMVGHPEKDKEQLQATSPVFHVDRIQAPLLVVQGAQDPRVKKAESDQIVEALRSRGVQVDYMVKDNEGHGFHLEENRFELYAKLQEFFSEHLLTAQPA
jgi:dipeptidyl aminopeptidase/acylaminoacyl peptidase